MIGATGMTAERKPLHVFYIQSYLSYLVCLAIVRHERLAFDDVLFLLDRGMQPNGRHRSVVLPACCKQIRLSIRGIMDNRRIGAMSRAFVEEVTQGRPFEYYTNRMNQLVNVHFTEMPTLEVVNFYEEGFAAYYIGQKGPAELQTKKQSLRERLIQTLSGLPVRFDAGFYPDAYSRIYGTSDRSFRGFPRRVEVDLMSAIDEEGAVDRFDDIQPGATVFALPLPHAFLKDPALEKNLENAMVACIQVAEKEIYFKFHPDRNDHSIFWNALTARVKARTGYDVQAHCVPDLPLELAATSRPDIVMAVVISSLAVYAEMFKCRVLSFAKVVFGADHWRVMHLVDNSPGAIFVEPGDDTAAIKGRLEEDADRMTEIHSTGSAR